MLRLNDRVIKVLNCQLDNDWQRELPSGSWVGFIYSESSSKTEIDKVLNIILDSNVTYVCCAGAMSELIHDMCDEEIAFRDVKNLPLPRHEVMTTFNRDLNEHLWFFIYVASSDEVIIDTVIILNMTNDENNKIVNQAILKIKNEK